MLGSPCVSLVPRAERWVSMQSSPVFLVLPRSVREVIPCMHTERLPHCADDPSISKSCTSICAPESWNCYHRTAYSGIESHNFPENSSEMYHARGTANRKTNSCTILNWHRTWLVKRLCHFTLTTPVYPSPACTCGGHWLCPERLCLQCSPAHTPKTGPHLQGASMDCDLQKIIVQCQQVSLVSELSSSTSHTDSL